MPILSPNIIRREVPTSGAPLRTAALRNVRPQVQYPQGPHDAPDPIRQSDYSWVGKPPSHGNARVPIFASQNIAAIDSIMSEHFHVVNQARPTWTGTPPHSGGQLTWRERTNIQRPAAMAYGSLFSLPRT